MGRREVSVKAIVTAMFNVSDIVIAAGVLLENKWAISCMAVIAIAVLAVAAIVIIKRVRSANGKAGHVRGSRGQSSAEQGRVEDCEVIIKRLKRIKKKYKTILFAAANVMNLPLTIPVNTAIELAKAGKRCLVIDLDLRRDAVAKAFKVDGQAGRNDLYPKAVKTEFEDLWVWPAHNFTKPTQMNIVPIVQKARGQFDFILINAPYLLSSPDRKHISYTAEAAFIFSGNGDEATRLVDLMKAAKCDLIGNIQAASK